MKKFMLVALLSVAVFFIKNACCLSSETGKWRDITNGIDEIDIRTVAIGPQSPALLYAGSTKSVFKSTDAGITWQKIYMVRGTLTSVNVIAVDPKNESIVYAGTQNGLFKSVDAGTTWDRIFEGAGNFEKEIRHMLVDAADTNKIYIGTGLGIFLSGDAGKTWNKVPGQISSQVINYIARDPVNINIIYCATLIGVFKSADGGLSWGRILTAMGQSEETEIEEVSQDANTNDLATLSNKTPNCLAIGENKVYAGANSGVFVLSDAEKSWRKLTNSGLINNKVMSLILAPDGSLYAGTQGGVFMIPPPFAKWDETYSGLSSKEIRYLAYNKAENSILAATKKGVFKTYLNNILIDRSDTPEPDVAGLLEKFESEPSIQEIQTVAIKYAEVNKEKIDAWRSAAQKKAIMPSVSIGVEKYLTDYYHWDSGTNPDTLQRGKAPTDWSVNLSWDLGELIWNDDQTSIDTRSRLMVQLRDDVLDEVTRLYFERRRLQLDLLTNPPKNIQSRLEKELRLQELTASIDALTGGWLSNCCKES